jgi:16S rRNA (guanine(527)-N(7))-methyltransferase RsmG
MLEASHAELTPEGYRQLWTFHQLLRERNGDGDLTRIRAFESMVTLHYVDCIYVAKKLGDKLPSPLLDIGSGAGFPGIPLKIAAPHLHIISSEGRARRVAFQDEAIEAMGLHGIETFCGKTFSTFPKPVQGIVTRALEKIPVTLSRVRAFVPPGGLAVFMKGPHCDEEIAEAQRDFARAWQLEDDIAYQLPFSTHHRRLVTFRRLHDPTELVRRRSRTIDSDANEGFKLLKSLLQPRGVKKAGATLIAGTKLIGEVLRDFPNRCEEILVPRGVETLPEEAPADLPVTVLRPELFRELDVSGTHAPLLKIRVDEPEVWDGRLHGCTLAVPFQDPENVGALLRTAAAFGVERAVLLREAASPWHPKALRAGGTAALRMQLFRAGPLTEVAAQLASQGHGDAIVSLSADGQPLEGFVFPRDFLMLPGVEGPGLPPELRSRALAIPMAGGTESLNGATAAAIALYVWYSGQLPEGGSENQDEGADA